MDIDLSVIVRRLSRLYTHSRARLAERAAAHVDHGRAAALPMIWFRDVKPDLRGRLASVTDSEKGARYAAWVIGEKLWAIGGRDLMDRVFSAFEADHGPRGASWLDHRWDGVGGSVWCA